MRSLFNEPERTEVDFDEVNEVRCKLCRARELYWEEARGERNQKKWVLMEANGSIHCCPKMTTFVCTADDFDVIEP